MKIGHGRAKLLVDTGASITLVWADAAARLGIAPESDAPYLPVRGVAGMGVARLVHARLTVGSFAESGIVIAVMPGKGSVDGLLGMTFLERFRATVSDELVLTPLDARDPEKVGGHGRSYWSARFKQNAKLKRLLKRWLGSAAALDAKIEASYGRSAAGDSVRDHVTRLERFVKSLDEELWREAYRFDVPKEWRR